MAGPKQKKKLKSEAEKRIGQDRSKYKKYIKRGLSPVTNVLKKLKKKKK